jgi:hypothetical protein
MKNEDVKFLETGALVQIGKSPKTWVVDDVVGVPNKPFKCLVHAEDNPENRSYFLETQLDIISLVKPGQDAEFPSVKDIKAMCKDAGVKYADLVFARPLGDDDHYSWDEVSWAVGQAHGRLEAQKAAENIEKQAPVVTGEPDVSTIQPTPAESPVEPSEAVTPEVSDPAQTIDADAQQPPAEGEGVG